MREEKQRPQLLFPFRAFCLGMQEAESADGGLVVHVRDEHSEIGERQKNAEQRRYRPPLVNVLLLTALGGIVFPKIPPRVCVPWLAFLGQHSLQVFAFQVVAFYLLLPVTSAVVAT